jgi:hypothetical protein
MTTKVIVLCPDNSLFDVRIQVLKGDELVQEADVPPHEQSDPIYLDETTRLVVSEVPRAPEPKAS